jgi:hypothetical protein
MYLSEKEMEAVLKLPGPKRFDYFVKKVADFGKVWGLFDKGWAMAGDDNGQEVLLLWPAKQYAQLSAVKDWASFQPMEISLEEFLNEWIPQMVKRNERIGVFLAPDGKGVISEPSELNTSLANELKKF